LALVFLTVSRPEYVTTQYSAYVERAASGLPPIVLVKQTGARSTITGNVLNARDNSAVPNAPVTLTRGQTDEPGGEAGSTTTDAAGNYSFSNLEAGTYTVESKPSGYSSCTRTAISVGPPAAASQNLACSPDGTNQIRIVLTWGQAPDDLDAHLTGPNADPSRFHVFYSSRGSQDSEINTPPFAKLDVDDTREEGPETITITRLNLGNYRYSVHDFTNEGNPGLSELGRSGARVELYLPGVPSPRTFFVPNQPGNLWTVFELGGNIANPTVTVRNEMGAGPSDSSAIP
jgi:hypothetical protein